jgi:hypothetical protein
VWVTDHTVLNGKKLIDGGMRDDVRVVRHQHPSLARAQAQNASFKDIFPDGRI